MTTQIGEVHSNKGPVLLRGGNKGKTNWFQEFSNNLQNTPIFNIKEKDYRTYAAHATYAAQAASVAAFQN